MAIEKARGAKLSKGEVAVVAVGVVLAIVFAYWAISVVSALIFSVIKVVLLVIVIGVLVHILFIKKR